MPRFVILEHDHPVRHWDFMLEAGDVLRTWRLADRPERGRAVLAEASFDHRCMYLDYEGPISGGRGCVARWDAGSFTWEADEPARVAVGLHGNRLQGRGVFEKTAAGGWSFLLTA